MKFFPENTLQQLEFDKIKDLIIAHARNDYAKNRIQQLRIHTKKDFIEQDLFQTNEFKVILDSGVYFPNDFNHNINKELKLLSIPGAMLTGEQFLWIRKLSDNTAQIFRWFDVERREQNPYLSNIIAGSYFEKQIRLMIDEVLDEIGMVKDNASHELASIRMNLYRKRNELRRVFDRIVSKMNKLGYLADIEESFMNGRRVLAVFAEQKRMIKGILHSESDSRRTTFIEPEETTGLNNDIFSLENEEAKEINRILRKLTEHLSAYAPLLSSYFQIAGEFEFVRAKAKFAQEIGGQLPLIQDKAISKLFLAYHPLLFLYNKRLEKPTIPVNLTLDENHRILVISGPNAGGKTVTLKTVGLLQIMFQSGLLVPVSPDSEMGIFKQMMIHIGDTQSIEFELSTYSAHLTHMKHFMENANGKTMFFIDELGSGSDPNLGGAFAEVIMEELAKKHAMGIVTTHYLNLKVMANKVAGVFNGAMQFDEKNLLPMYQLKVGSPGSSYTFSIAERIGLSKHLIEKARKLVNENHFQLDKLLNSTEQDMQAIEKEKKQLQQLLSENEKLKKEMEVLIKKEKHQQEVEKLKLSNKIAEDKLIYLKDMERKLKALIIEWRKSENKDSVIKMMHTTLTGQKEKYQAEKQQKKINEKFLETDAQVKVGHKVKMKQNKQVGIVKEIRGKKALLQVGVVPILVAISDLIVVMDKPVVTES
jgi:DNA mismatch repair protein MutS2